MAMMKSITCVIIILLSVAGPLIARTSVGVQSAAVLKASDFKHHVDYFNTMEPETIVNHIPNADAWAWMVQTIPFFACPDRDIEEIYYYRWWTLRKHIKHTEDGFVFTEFLDTVGHSGKYNTISCALGHHICEATWLRDRRYLDDYARFWYTGHEGGLQPHLHKYSNWGTWALYRRYLVHGDEIFLCSLLEAFQRDYETWTTTHGLENGLLWQYDVRDGMEESISGSRRVKNVRPPLNSYIVGNARAIARIAELAGQTDTARIYTERATRLTSLIHDLLWDAEAAFFKVRQPDGELANVREAIGYIPWYFNIPRPGHEGPWQQLTDPNGFMAPMGITTAERRHPAFRSHGVGTCEWDGAVWPFATSQTLVALANVLRNYEQPYVSKQDYFNALKTYARSHRYRDRPYIGEYLDEKTGQWLTPDSDRSRYYNHSTFCDLVICGLVGLIPQEGRSVLIDPLVPESAWDWFCLDRVPYHGHLLTVVWDRTGQKFNRGNGLRVYADGREIALSEKLERLQGELP